LLDSEGNRLLAKYYQPVTLPDGKPLTGGAPAYTNPFKTLKEQRAFEQGMWEKTRRAQGKPASCSLSSVLRLYGALSVYTRQDKGDILLYNSHLVLFKPSIDLTFYVVGPESENELMLNGVLNALHDSVSLLLRHQVEKRAILENLDLVVLCLDETVDEGYS
jgi:coatomer subunit zeta